jgi:TonB family protein
VEPEQEQAEPEPAPTVVEERPAAPPEQVAGGTDEPVRLEGAPFPYPEYLANIILQIKRHWRPPTGGVQWRSELAFTILRDGSVEDVSWVRRSGNPAFDLEARGAIEAAGRRGVFGPLPDEYPSDRLRVSFFFDPTRY